MFLLVLLGIIALLLIGIVVFATCVGGTVFLVLFADVIVCVAFITLIIRRIIKKRRKRRLRP